MTGDGGDQTVLTALACSYSEAHRRALLRLARREGSDNLGSALLAQRGQAIPRNTETSCLKAVQDGTW